MMNIGFNPTVSGHERSIEIHYFDFDSNLYDQKISVSVVHRLRSEQKFSSVDLLKEQLEKDKMETLRYLKL